MINPAEFSPALMRALERQQEVVNAIGGVSKGSALIVRSEQPDAYAIHLGEPMAHLESLAETIGFGVRMAPNVTPSRAAAGALLDGMALGYFLAQEQERATSAPDAPDQPQHERPRP